MLPLLSDCMQFMKPARVRSSLTRISRISGGDVDKFDLHFQTRLLPFAIAALVAVAPILRLMEMEFLV